MTKQELLHVKEVLDRIKNPSSRVEFAKACINKDLAIRDNQRDNFKGKYDSDELSLI